MEDEIICRCEEVYRSEIIEAIRAGDADNALQQALLHLKYVREIIGY